jgi:hypothetical protein
MNYPDVAEMLDSDKILAISHPPGTPDRVFGAFPRSAQVDRLAGELEQDAEEGLAPRRNA